MTGIAEEREILPGYFLRQRLGSGGYGEVWSATAPGGLSKAIKIVYGRFDEDRASREMKALDRVKDLRHPFLLSVERIEVADNQLVIVTELADSSLKDRFEQCRRAGDPGIPRDELLDYIREAADALDYMRERHSLQHLDIKPENILLAGGHAKVADFGLVKGLAEALPTMLGGLTPHYAPPEIFDGLPSRHSDQYSLALVFAEMLTGRLPFSGTSAAQLAAQHLQGVPNLADLPQELQPVIARALAKRPDDRHPGCRELAKGLLRATAMPWSEADRPDDSGSSSSDGAEGLGSPRTPTHRAAGAPTVDEGAPRRGTIATQTVDSLTGATPATPAAWAAGPAVSPLERRTSQPVVSDEAPTFWIGLGGLGEAILQRLRQQLHQRSRVAAAPMGMLVIDTGARGLAPEAGTRPTSGPEVPYVHIQTPLFPSTHYRNRSDVLTQTLSRRWIYNVPKSLKTERMRPLGRLAFLDHRDRIADHLTEAVTAWTAEQSGMAAMVSPEASRDSVGSSVGSLMTTARIVVVACISGGTGGGMLPDLLAEIDHLRGSILDASAGVDLVLLHGSPRVLRDRELARANSVATLREVYQHLLDSPARGRYAVNVIPLGDDLHPEQFDASVETTADYLLMHLTARFRREAERLRPRASVPLPKTDRALTPGTTRVSASGVPPIGEVAILPLNAYPSDLLDRVGGVVTHEYLQRLVGSADPTEYPAVALAKDARKVSGLRIGDLHETTLAALSETRPREMAERLAEAVTALTNAPPAVIPTRLAELCNQTLGGLGDGSVTPRSPLGEAVQTVLRSQIAERTAKLVEVIASLADRPDGRLTGVTAVVKTLLRSLKSDEATARQEIAQLTEGAQRVLAALTTAAQTPHTGGASARLSLPLFGGAARPDQVTTLDAGMREYLACRQAIVATQARRDVLVVILHRLQDLLDRTADLGRLIESMSRSVGFDRDLLESLAADLSKGRTTGASAAVLTYFLGEVPRLVEALSDRVEATELPLAHLGAYLAATTPMPPSVIADLSASVHAILQGDIASLRAKGTEFEHLLGPGDRKRKIASWLELAQPKLARRGGTKRAWLRMPEERSRSALNEELTAITGAGAWSYCDPQAPGAILVTLAGVPWGQAVAELTGGSAHYLELAEKLAARTDIVLPVWDGA